MHLKKIVKSMNVLKQDTSFDLQFKIFCEAFNEKSKHELVEAE